MINPKELRIGNLVMHKVGTTIKKVPCQAAHFSLLDGDGVKDFYPIVLKPELFKACGFLENKDYPLAPAAREFILTLPVIGSNRNEIMGYAKSNGECFARAAVNGLTISNNVFHLHAVQNLYFALIGEELSIKI